MYPERLLAGVSWSFADSAYGSLEEFVKFVSEYHVSLELSADWKAHEIAVDAPKLTIVTEEVYDENDEEVDITFELNADGPGFTNGELLFKLHNAFAEKIKAGYELGDHCCFEGLNFREGTDGQYDCFVGG